MGVNDLFWSPQIPVLTNASAYFPYRQKLKAKSKKKKKYGIIELPGYTKFVKRDYHQFSEECNDTKGFD